MPTIQARLAVLAVSAALATALAGAAASVPAAADPAGDFPRVKGVSILVAPPRLFVPAGQVIKVQRVEIENRGSVPLDLRAITLGIVQNPDGSASPEPPGPYSAVNWIAIAPGQFTVAPGATRFIQVRIHVPPHAEPGDHDVAITFLDQPQGIRSPGNIKIAAGVSIPTLITVPGRVSDHVTVTRVTARRFSAGGPITITATVRESGNVHHSFRGSGSQLTASVDGTAVSFPPATVLSGSTITLTTQWARPPAMCLCHVTVDVATGGHQSQAAATVIIFPVGQAAGGAGTVIALALLSWLAQRYQRRKLRAAYEAGRAAASR
jgi:hypothetical protein